jgi:hypothetical protein
MRYLLLLCVLLLPACQSAERNDQLRARLYQYSAAIRWNEIEQALTFVDPAVLAERPFSTSDREAWKSTQVARYVEGPQSIDAEGRVSIAVQLELIDRDTQSVRAIVDRQRWRYDAERKTWWLTTGLPAIAD